MKIGINCGHTVSGTTGSGATGFLNESNETRSVGKKLIEYLVKAGHTVYDCTNDRADSVSANLATICSMANKQTLDLFVSIHFNAGGGKGAEVYTYNGAKHSEAVKTCEKLHDLGFVNRGVKDGKSLYVIKHTNAKAMLIEVCFVDTQSDAALYQKLGAAKVAAAICEAITGSKPATSSGGGETKVYFSDTKGHYAEKYIQKLADYGIVNGENGKFNPDKPITKAEAAVIAANVLTVLGK